MVRADLHVGHCVLLQGSVLLAIFVKYERKAPMKSQIYPERKVQVQVAGDTTNRRSRKGLFVVFVS